MLSTKPRDPLARRGMPGYGGSKKRRLSPLMILGISIPALIALIGVGVFVVAPRFASHAATAALNMNCTLIVPPNPLSAKGLSTPYQLVATDPNAGPCNEANAGQSAFVQAAILDPATGAISAYEPLVIDQGTQPAVAPVVPVLPANAVVGTWFGFNATLLTLQRNARTHGMGGKVQKAKVALAGTGMANGNCVNGVANSVFGQFAYCNAVNFFKAANQAIAAGKLVIPPLATSPVDGQACPTTRAFSVVDMDQSDNVQTRYLVTANGQIAQFSAANQALFPNATPLGNPSDNALVTTFLDPALGCQSIQVPDLANPGATTAAMATDELQAAAGQQAPIALVPAGDEMVLNNANPSLAKVNAYRRGVDQTQAASIANDANTTTYCQNLVNISPARLNLDMANFAAKTSPDGGAASNSLFTFLANRLNASLGAGGLNCVGLLNIQNPVTLTTDGNGVVIAATILNTPLPATTTGGTTTGGTTTGGVQQIATGGATIALDTNAGNAPVQLNITYPGHPNQLINVGIATNSCTGTPVFTQPENTDGNSMNQASTVINGLQGLTALPANWFFTVSDPAQNNAIVGCGSVAVTGVNGTATLGTVVTPAAATTACTPATTAATTPAGTVAACATATMTAQGGTTTGQGKGNKSGGKKHQKW